MHQSPYRSGTLALGLVLLLSACGASDADGSAGDGDSAASGTGPRVMVIGDFTSTIPFTVPEAVPAAEGALRDTGIEVLSCDSEGNPNALQSCARRAVDEGVVAVINSWSSSALDQSILSAAGIPVVGSADVTDEHSYATSSASAQYVAMGVGLAEAGCTELGVLFLSGPGEVLVDYVTQGIESQGGEEVVRTAVAANSPDLSADIAKITGAGADCLALSLPPTVVAQAITAVEQSGADLLMAGITAVFTDELLASLGDLTEGLLVVDNQLSPSDPATEAVREDMDAVGGEDADVTQVGIIAWVAGKLIGTAFEGMEGEATPASMIAALDALQDVEVGGVIPPWTSEPLDNPEFARLMNPYGISYQIQDGERVRTGDFYDLTPILDR